MGEAHLGPPIFAPEAFLRAAYSGFSSRRRGKRAGTAKLAKLTKIKNVKKSKDNKVTNSTDMYVPIRNVKYRYDTAGIVSVLTLVFFGRGGRPKKGFKALF